MDRREEKFWNNCVKCLSDNGCWNWLGTLNGDGYGKCCYKGKNTSAHRMSWILHNKKEIPKNMVIMHLCDNRSCMNPAHLMLGTQAENMKDMREKMRYKKTKADRSYTNFLRKEERSKLSFNQVQEIRTKYSTKKYSQMDLAQEYMVSQSRISYIVNNLHRTKK